MDLNATWLTRCDAVFDLALFTRADSIGLACYGEMIINGLVTVPEPPREEL